MDNGSVHGWHLRRVVSFFRFCASMLYRRIAKSFLRPSIPTREDHSFIVMPIYSCALRIKWWRGWNGSATRWDENREVGWRWLFFFWGVNRRSNVVVFLLVGFYSSQSWLYSAYYPFMEKCEVRGRKISRGHGKFLFQLKLHSSANSSTNRLLIG